MCILTLSARIKSHFFFFFGFSFVNMAVTLVKREHVRLRYISHKVQLEFKYGIVSYFVLVLGMGIVMFHSFGLFLILHVYFTDSIMMCVCVRFCFSLSFGFFYVALALATMFSNQTDNALLFFFLSLKSKKRRLLRRNRFLVDLRWNWIYNFNSHIKTVFKYSRPQFCRMFDIFFFFLVNILILNSRINVKALDNS